MNMGGLSGLDDLNEMYESIILDHYRNPRKSEKIENSDSFKTPKLELTTEQEKAIQELYSLDNKKFDVLVLDGITGSGKTRVYMHKVIESIKDGFQSLILVPEIILTEQWVKEIEKDFGIKALVYHSSVKKTVREKIWLNMIRAYIDFEKRNFKKK